MKTTESAKGVENGSSGSAPVWIGVGLLFAFLAMAWAAMFFFASKHRALDVPLATQPVALTEAH